MKKDETDPAATEPAGEVAAPAVTTTQPTTIVTQPSRSGVGTGILIAAIAAALVGGLGIGGVSGFALANATGHQRPQLAQQGQQGGMPGGGQQGGQQGGMPGQPPQGGQPGGPQGVLPNPNGGQTGGQTQDDSDSGESGDAGTDTDSGGTDSN